MRTNNQKVNHTIKREQKSEKQRDVVERERESHTTSACWSTSSMLAALFQVTGLSPLAFRN